MTLIRGYANEKFHMMSLLILDLGCGEDALIYSWFKVPAFGNGSAMHCWLHQK
jgi:hypothetical protein